eukprot:3545502-Prymnesium_polylepis.2
MQRSHQPGYHKLGAAFRASLRLSSAALTLEGDCYLPSKRSAWLPATSSIVRPTRKARSRKASTIPPELVPASYD